MGKNWPKSGEKWKNSGRGRKHQEEKAKIFKVLSSCPCRKIVKLATPQCQMMFMI